MVFKSDITNDIFWNGIKKNYYYLYAVYLRASLCDGTTKFIVNTKYIDDKSYFLLFDI